jgi:hypothetical protein
MPVTARLSKLFYERLGEQVAGELVDWFNAVDATYRNDLRELNELNFARFDAKLEQRIAQVEARIAELEAKFEMRFSQLGAELLGEIAKLDAKLERRLGEQTRWLVGIWLTVILAAVAVWIRK